MIFDDSPHDRESESKAFGLLTGDGFGEPREDFVRNEGTVVLNRQNNVPSFPEDSELDRRLAGVRSRFHCVAKKIHDHELEFDGAPVHPEGIAFLGRRGAVFGKERGIGFAKVCREISEVNRFLGGLALAGVLADAVHDGAGSLGLLGHALAHRNDFLLGELSLRGPPHETVGKEPDGGERLVNLVGDEARELSHDARALQGFDAVALGPFSFGGFLKFRFTPPNEHVGAPGVEKKGGKERHGHGDMEPVAAQEALERPGLGACVGTERERRQQFVDGLEVGRDAPGSSARLCGQGEK